MTTPISPDGDGWFAATIDGRGIVADGDDGFVALVGPGRDEVVGAELAPLVARRHRDALQRLRARGHGTELIAGRRHDGLPWRSWLHASAPPGGGTRLSGRRAGGPLRWRDEPAPASEGEAPEAPTLDHVVSHDLRGALRGARGFTTIAARALAPEGEPVPAARAKTVDHLATAARSVHVADQLAEGVVRSMRWTDGPFVLERVDLADLVDRAHTIATDAHPAIELDGPARGIGVVVDRERATWLLAELMTNAAKVARGPVRLHLTWGAEPGDDDWGVLRVADDGPGVDPALADAAFHPGRMLQPRGELDGVGMGLALCRIVAERHGGWCGFAPATGEGGACVAVCLPVDRPPGSAPEGEG